jgi:hypothetical protein
MRANLEEPHARRCKGGRPFRELVALVQLGLDGLERVLQLMVALAEGEVRDDVLEGSGAELLVVGLASKRATTTDLPASRGLHPTKQRSRSLQVSSDPLCPRGESALLPKAREATWYFE